MRKVLELRAFRRLLAAAVFNEIAVSVATVALALFVYRRTGSALGAMAFFLAAEFGPAFFSPLLVARLDQRSVRGVLTLLFAVETLIFLLLALMVRRLSVAGILTLTLLDGTLAVAAGVLARSAWTSATSPAGLLREASAIINSSLSVCYMLGPALAGLVVAVGGTRTALLVSVGLFALVTATVASAQGLPNAVAKRVSSSGRIRAAVAYARAEPLIRRLLGLQALGMLFFTVSIPVEVVFARHTLHAGASGYGILLAAWGAGTIIGSAFYARWRARSLRLLMTLGTLLLSTGFFVMSLAPSLALAVAAAAVAGAGNGIQIVAMRTALQETTPKQWMALILSLNESMFQAVPGAGFVLGGVIAALAGPRAALALGAAGSFFVGCLIWLGLAALGDSRTATVARPEDAVSDANLTAAARHP